MIQQLHLDWRRMEGCLADSELLAKELIASAVASLEQVAECCGEEDTYPSVG